MEYSTAIYTTMPIKQLLLKSREKQNLYEDIYPPLLRLVTKNYPHLCLVEDYMFEEEIKEDRELDVSWFKHTQSESRKPPCSPEELRTGKALFFSCNVESKPHSIISKSLNQCDNVDVASMTNLFLNWP